jgi:hypothetical protein
MEVVLIKSVVAVLMSLASAKGVVISTADAAGGPAILNVILNFASLAILIVGVVMAPRAFRAKGLQLALQEKDQVIATKLQLAEARNAEIAQQKERLRDMGFQLDAMQHDAALWRGRYEEQQQYTAEPALEAIKVLLEHTNTQAERRHTEMLAALSKVPSGAEGEA